MIFTDGIGDDADPYATTIGYIAVVLTMTLFLAPVQTCLQVRRDGDIRDFSEVSFVTSLFNCLLWIVYASITPGRLVCVTQMFAVTNTQSNQR